MAISFLFRRSIKFRSELGGVGEFLKWEIGISNAGRTDTINCPRSSELPRSVPFSCFK